MTTNNATPTTEIAVLDPQSSDAERYALGAFLAGYRGQTRDAYALDLRQFVAWCDQHDLRLFAVRRADIECFARDLEELGRATATVARRLSTVAGFYRYADEEGLLSPSPAAHVRRPRIDYESHATGLDRNEVGVLLVAAGLASARDHALISLLAINGLRVSEALGANIEALGIERGHRTLTVVRKGGKIVIIPLVWGPPAHRPGDRRTLRRADLPRRKRRPARPPRRMADRAPPCSQGRDQQAGRPAHAAPRVHHRRTRRRRAAARRRRSRQPRRPENHHAL